MKIRIDDGSLRFRLGSEDLAALGTRDELSQFLATSPDARLTFTLRLSEPGGEWSLSQEKNTVLLRVPKPLVRAWLAGRDVELEKRLNDPSLLVMIEKDLHG